MHALGLAIVLQCTAAKAVAADAFVLTVVLHDDGIELRSAAPAMSIRQQGGTTVADLRDLYAELEDLTLDEADGTALLEQLGRDLLGPLANPIRAAQRIEFLVPPEALELPLDALFLDGEPLFLQRPVSFRLIGNARVSDGAAPRLRSAVVVSDETADPLRGAFAVGERFPDARVFDVADADLSTLAAMDAPDVLLLSVHGFVDGSADDHVALGDQRLDAEGLAALGAPLVYLDSCRTGVSAPMLGALFAGATRHVVAPVLSNEAGASSARTMQAFFDALAAGADAEQALFETRRALWQELSRDELVMRLWRAWPFRLYRPPRLPAAPLGVCPIDAAPTNAAFSFAGRGPAHCGTINGSLEEDGVDRSAPAVSGGGR